MMAKMAIPGGELAYTREGAGVPLVCLHGGLGIDSATLRVPGITGLAQRGCEVVIFDQRGHGDSSALPDEQYTHALWAGDVFELAHGLGWGRYALLGHSYGGFIALEHALRWPEAVSHLVLVATSAGPVPQPSVSFASAAELGEYFRRAWPHFFLGDDKYTSVLDRCRFSAAPYNAAFGRELPRYDVSGRVAEITAPALLIVGSEDPYRRDMEWLAGRLPHASLHVLENAGHFPFVEAGEAFLELVAGFLTGA